MPKEVQDALCEAMKDLPVERLQPSPPFTNVGVDFFGPFTIKGEVQKRTRGKCFGVIFTCFACRAVYVDVSSDYSTDRFPTSSEKICKRKRLATESHNGTQLVAASKELKDVVRGWMKRLSNLTAWSMRQIGNLHPQMLRG